MHWSKNLYEGKEHARQPGQSKRGRYGGRSLVAAGGSPRHQTREPFEDALDAALETEAGRQLRKLRDGPRRHERADEWQANVAKERAEEWTAALGSSLPG